MLNSTHAELLKPNFNPFFTPKNVFPEKEVLLERAVLTEGKFDFLVESIEGKTIGVEVLTRPTPGKLLKKLSYAKKSDEFIFVLPCNSLELYKKKKNNGLHFFARKKSLPPEFASKSLFIWLFDPTTKEFLSKGVFSKEFNTATAQ